MFLAHLPAGYLLSRKIGARRTNKGRLVATGLFVSVLPDFDLLWYYLVDRRQTLHHDYVFHWPLFWTALAILAWLIVRLLKCQGLTPYIVTAWACLILHMVLDSIAAGIGWLRPFWDAEINLVEVPARHDWWVWNFILHWTFLAELALILAAGMMLWRDLRT